MEIVFSVASLALILLNKNLEHSCTVTVSVNSYNYAAKGTRYDWNIETVGAGKGVTESPIENLGANFTIEVPRYGVTLVAIPGAK